MQTRFNSTSMRNLAEQERQFISQRTTSALKSAKERGVRLGSPDPSHRCTGSCKEGENFLRDAEKVAGVIVPLRASGASLKRICEVLNASGARTSRGGHFNQPLVSRMLKRLDAVAWSQGDSPALPFPFHASSDDASLDASAWWRYPISFGENNPLSLSSTVHTSWTREHQIRWTFYWIERCTLLVCLALSLLCWRAERTRKRVSPTTLELLFTIWRQGR